MKKVFTKIFLLLAFTASAFAIFYGCSEQKFAPTISNNTTISATTTNDLSAASVSPFHKGVGGLIDGELGRKWIANYSRTNKAAMSYPIHSDDVQKIIGNKNCVGISLYYAKDANGQLHILPVGVNASGKAIPEGKVPTINGDINWALAMKWIDNYSGAVHAHFFGVDMYRTMITAKKCSTIKLSFALNDDNQPQLLMSNSNETTPAEFGDKSYTCPPFCN